MKWLTLELGDQFVAADLVAVPRARLEKCGLSILRSMVKLVHEGCGAYTKGDGPQVKAWLMENGYENANQRALGRIEQSKRQDSYLEVSENCTRWLGPFACTRWIPSSLSRMCCVILFS